MNHLLEVNPVKKLLALSLMILLMFGTILLATPAGADTINATVKYNLGGSPWVSFKVNGATKNWYTEYWLDVDGADPYDAFCIENIDAYLGEGVYDILTPGDGFYKAAWIAENYYTDDWSNDATYNKSEVQSAIWEVLFESSSQSFGVASNQGNFWINYTKNVVDITNIDMILSSVTAAFENSSFNENSFPGIKIASFTQSANGNVTSNRQDYIYYDPSPPNDTNHTPEPATMLLFGVGLIGLAGVIRKKSIS